MKAILTVFFSLLFANLTAQNTMRITYTDGSIQDVSVDKVADITFVDKTPDTQEAVLQGSWLWGKAEAGYYELITFNSDNTYIGDDCYFEYGFNTKSYGNYMHSGIRLSLYSNGYGYMRTFRWFVTSLTENALEVMTQTGPYVYYRLQPNVLRVKVDDDALPTVEGEDVVFADGVTAKLTDGKLYGLVAGTTYIQKRDPTTGLIWAYKLVVE